MKNPFNGGVDIKKYINGEDFDQIGFEKAKKELEVNYRSFYRGGNLTVLNVVNLCKMILKNNISCIQESRKTNSHYLHVGDHILRVSDHHIYTGTQCTATHYVTIIDGIVDWDKFKITLKKLTHPHQ